MVPALSFVFMAVSMIISIGIPVLLVIWVMKKYKPGFWAVLSGIIVFTAVQMVFRIPLIQVFGLTNFGKTFIENNLLAYIAILSLTAGLVEEFGRYFAFKVMLKKKRDLKHGIAYGIGHGGIEAILIVGISFAANIVYSILINAGVFSALPGIEAVAMQPVIDALVNTPSLNFLLGGLERLFAICLHIALSVLVLYGVRKKKISFTFLAILIHGLVNFVAVYIAQNVNIFLSEGFLFVVATASIVFIFKMRGVFTKQDGQMSISE